MFITSRIEQYLKPQSKAEQHKNRDAAAVREDHLAIWVGNLNGTWFSKEVLWNYFSNIGRVTHVYIGQGASSHGAYERILFQLILC